MTGIPWSDRVRHDVRLVVLCFGSEMASEVNLLRQKILPALREDLALQGLSAHFRQSWPSHGSPEPWTPADSGERAPEEIPELVADSRNLLLVLIGPDLNVADAKLLRDIRDERPGADSGVLYVFISRPKGDPETARVLFSELWRDAWVYGYRNASEENVRQALVHLIVKGGDVALRPRVTGLLAGRGVDDSANNLWESAADSLDDHWPKVPSYESRPPEPPAERDHRIIPGRPWAEPMLGQQRPPAMAVRPGEQARRSEPRRPVVDENVQFTVYRPNAVVPEVWYPLLAFAHLAERRPDAPAGDPSPLEQVRALARQAGVERTYSSPRADARAGVPQESQLTFVPLIEGVDFNPRSQTFEWQEDVHQQTFRLLAHFLPESRVRRGRLTVYLGAFILADIDLVLEVDVDAEPPPTQQLSRAAPSRLTTGTASAVVTASPYQKVFASYSHKDVAIVQQAEAYGEALGHVYLRDRLTLRSGEDWEERLLTLIEEADVFQLFWSSNSMVSDYVRREWEHALSLDRPSFIRPTYWEVPMPRSSSPELPPRSLALLHFHGFSGEPTVGPGRARPVQAYAEAYPSQGAQHLPLPPARRSTGGTRRIGYAVGVLSLVAAVVLVIILFVN